MKKGACFKCEETGHMAKDHDEYERKKKEKKKAILRKTDTAPTTPTPPAASPSKKKDLSKIHALLQALSAEETETLLAMKGEKKEEKDEDSDSDF